jgi:hypothetical protein
MPAETALAPIAVPTGEIDLADYTFPNPGFIGSLGHLADELVAGRSGKTVVSTLEFEVGGTDSGGQQTNPGESLGYARQRLLADLNASRFQVNG